MNKSFKFIARRFALILHFGIEFQCIFIAANQEGIESDFPIMNAFIGNTWEDNSEKCSKAKMQKKQGDDTLVVVSIRSDLIIQQNSKKDEQYANYGEQKCLSDFF